MNKVLSAKILKLERIVRQDPLARLTDRQLNDRLVMTWHSLRGEDENRMADRERALAGDDAGEPALFDCRWPHLFRHCGFHDEQRLREMVRQARADLSAGVL
jgi:hypothetical protein